MKKPTFLFMIVAGSIVLLLGSCFYATRIINRRYEYSTPKVATDGWEVRAKLHGTWQQHGKYQDLAGPYSLMLWIKPPADSQQDALEVSVRMIGIHEAGGADVTPPNAPLVMTGRIMDSGEYFFETLDFDLSSYTRLRILLEITILNHEGSVISTKEVEVTFDPEFEEYPSNRIWDGMMSA